MATLRSKLTGRYEELNARRIDLDAEINAIQKEMDEITARLRDTPADILDIDEVGSLNRYLQRQGLLPDER